MPEKVGEALAGVGFTRRGDLFLLGEDDSWPASGPVREFAISSVDAFGIRLVGDEPHLRDLATLEGAHHPTPTLMGVRSPLSLPVPRCCLQMAAVCP